MSDIGNEIKNRIYKYAAEIFCLDFDSYLKENNRNLYGVLINPEKKKFEHLFGDMPDNFLPTINTQFHDTIAGYRVNVGGHFITIDVNADVFLINKNNINDPEKETDALIIHELCHMIIDSNSLEKINFQINSKDIYHGNKLYKKTDYVNQRITRHTEEFCHILAAGWGRAESAD